MEFKEQIITTQDLEVKQEIIEIQQYCVSREIERSYGDEPIFRAEMIDRAKDLAKHELLEGLSEFVGFDFEPYDQRVIARIHMPYVYDKELKQTKNQLEIANISINMLKKEKKAYESLVAKYEKTWWIKLKLWVGL